MDDPFFPVDLDGLPVLLEVHEIESGSKRKIGPYDVSAAKIFHPAPALAYRIEADGKSLVYATDTEDPFSGQANPVVELARGADALIHDGQFLDSDFKPGWGHSTVASAIDVAGRARAKRRILYHHDPDRTDDALDETAIEAQGEGDRRGGGLRGIGARGAAGAAVQGGWRARAEGAGARGAGVGGDGGGVGRGGHDGDVRRRGGEPAVLLHERPAVHDRHAQVQQDERGRVDLDEVERRGAVRRGRDGIVVAQRRAQRLAELVVVIDDEDSGPGTAAVPIRTAELPQRDLALPFGFSGAATAGAKMGPGGVALGWRGGERSASLLGRPSLV